HRPDFPPDAFFKDRAGHHAEGQRICGNLARYLAPYSLYVRRRRCGFGKVPHDPRLETLAKERWPKQIPASFRAGPLSFWARFPVVSRERRRELRQRGFQKSVMTGFSLILQGALACILVLLALLSLQLATLAIIRHFVRERFVRMPELPDEALPDV